MIGYIKDKVSPQERDLLLMLFEGHRKATFRQNVSTAAVQCAAAGSGDLTKAVIAGLSTLGDRHAPIAQTMNLFRETDDIFEGLVESGVKVPGWGNAFVKDQPDQIWSQIHDFIAKEFNSVGERISRRTEILHAHGKNIFPNAACYSAVTAMIVGIPPDAAIWLVIAGRLDHWTKLFMEARK